MSAKTGEADLFANALGGVLEDMAFIFTDQLAEDELSADPGESLAVEMSFLGPQRGTVTLAAQFALCVELAVNMLGSERDDVSRPMASDALKEILNMACGQFLVDKFGSRPVFNLTVPEVKAIGPAEWSALLDCSGSRLLKADEWQMVTNIRMQEKG